MNYKTLSLNILLGIFLGLNSCVQEVIADQTPQTEPKSVSTSNTTDLGPPTSELTSGDIAQPAIDQKKLEKRWKMVRDCHFKEWNKYRCNYYLGLNLHLKDWDCPNARKWTDPYEYAPPADYISACLQGSPNPAIEICTHIMSYVKATIDYRSTSDILKLSCPTE